MKLSSYYRNLLLIHRCCTYIYGYTSISLTPISLNSLTPISLTHKQTMTQRRGSFTIKSALSSFLSPSTDSNNHNNNNNNTTTQPNKSRRHSTIGTISNHNHNHNNATTHHSIPRSNTTVSPSSKYNNNNNNNKVKDTKVKDNNNSSNALNQYLLSRGFLTPKKININRDETTLNNINNSNCTKDIDILVATTGEYIFLPTISSNDDEYLTNLNALGDVSVSDTLSEPLSNAPMNNNIASSNNNSTTQQNNNDTTMTPYNIAIILAVHTPTTLSSSLHVELSSRLKLYWNNGVPPTRSFDEEVYKCSSMAWDIPASKYNAFIPSSMAMAMATSIAERDDIDQTRRVVEMLPLSERQYIDPKNKQASLFWSQDANTIENIKLAKGHYIFILPCTFNNHIPESLYYPAAKLDHSLKIGTVINDNTIIKNNNNNTTITSLSSSSLNSLNKTELEKAQSNKNYIKNSIIKKVKNTINHIQNDSTNNNNNNTGIYPYDQHHHLIMGEFPIKIIRTPPPISISTANKPIYINRIWTDSLSYEISFAQKYVSLNSKVPIKIKLAPLEKNMCIKRIKISLNEKITFVSKNLEFEYDQVDPVAKDPYNPYYLDFQAKRRKERNLPLLEIRTKEKGARALREEIVENTIDDNLLSYSMISNDDEADNNKKNNSKKKSKDKPPIGITEPISIETVLDFPKFEDLDKKRAKIIPPYGIDSFQMIPNPEHYNSKKEENLSHRSSVISILKGSHHNHHQQQQSDNDSHNNNKIYDKRFHQTKLKTNSGVDIKYHTKLNESKRGLYLDSMHLSNIHARHKLEIMLRISKPDPQDPTRLRHYEVLIDTPIFLVSELCNSGNMELPTYHMATIDTDSNKNIVVPTTFNNTVNDPFNPILPPTFEEAISVPNSPLMSPMGSPNMVASYDPDNLYIQQLNLSRGASISGPSVISAPFSTTVNDEDENSNNNNSGNTGNTDDTSDNTSDLYTNISVNNTTQSTNTYSNIPTQPDNGETFNNLDNLLSSPSLFKKNYNLNCENKKPSTNCTDNGNHNHTTSDVETLSDPPNYDDAVNT